MCCSTPSPPQAGQAPNGLLNENSRGSISEMVKPETGQANFSEKISRSAVSFLALLALLPPTGAAPSANSTTASPSASLSAVSSESARRVAMSGRTTTRSTTTSMSWLNFLSSAGASAIS